jgi:uncharacterized protein DUF4145
MTFKWQSTQQIKSAQFKCGYCQNHISSNSGYQANDDLGLNRKSRHIYICHHCEKPTFLDQQNYQTPSPAHGNDVEHVPEDINKLYNQARNCMKQSAYTATVLLCRKLLMHIGVEKGAPTGKNFLEYVNYLSDKNYVPPDGKVWVDHIRKKGNEANHEIVIMGQEDAKDLINFLEMLLKFIYEFSGKLANKTPKK